MEFIAYKCLIVDDQAESVTLLVSYLMDKGIDILVALEGEDGLLKARKAQPDLILLDVSMPGMDGFEVCRQLNEDPQTRAIPVVFLSGRDSVEDKLQGFALGAVDYITKPFVEAEVVARVMVHLHTKSRIDFLETVASQRVVTEAGVSVPPEEKTFVKAVSYLEEHLADSPGVAKLARKLGTNERKLNEIFRRRTAMTVFDFLTEMRLDKARRLLEGSSLQVQLIAEQVGYQNAGDLTRAFRRRYSVPPREYRRAKGASAEN